MTETQVRVVPRQRRPVSRREVLRRLARLDVVAEPGQRWDVVVRVQSRYAIAYVPPGSLSRVQVGAVLDALGISWRDFDDMR